jgi:class 3 adenylate cyclase/pimeloyl-ACP methyl ester carboxylesterase
LYPLRDIEVEYAVHDGASIAFTVFGRGPVDLVVSTSRFPIDLMWELPQLAEFMDTLGSVARVITYDPRGSGASDPLPTTEGGAGIESQAADLLAVMNATGCDRATIFTMDSGTLAGFFAATYPERVQSVIITNLRTSFPEMRGYSIEQRKKMARALATTRGLRSDNPRVAHDPVLQRWWGRAHRATSPEATARQMEFAADTDVESVLSSVRAPTLVLHRKHNQLWDIETSRLAASLLPNARFVELPGSENDIFLGETGPALAEITKFLDEAKPASTGDDRPLATVLFTDMVASTEHLAEQGDQAWRVVLDAHDAAMAHIVADYGGRLIKSTGDGILATFDGPARAVRCAAKVLDAAHGEGITLRAGLHTGEIEVRPGDIAGIAVHTASRIAHLAGPNEILVSRTVVDLTAGADLQFQPHGEHQLKGVPGTWPLFKVQSAEAAP